MNKKLITTIGISVIAIVVVGVIIALICGIGNSKPDIYKQGDIVKIPIKVTKNPGMVIAKTVVNYDDAVLEYVECEGGIFTDNTVSTKDGKATCVLMANFTADLKDNTETGTIATLVFKVKKGATKGESLISIDEENSEYANLREKFVTPKVSITEKIIIE